MRNIAIYKKSVVIIIILLVVVILFEYGLNKSNFKFLFEKSQPLIKKDNYRIICLGDSVTTIETREFYPEKLEKSLNEKKIGINFEVIDVTRIGMPTEMILSQLEKRINEYQPDIAIVMTGINDPGESEVRLELYDKKIKMFFKSLNIYKLAKFIKFRTLNKFKKIESFVSERKSGYRDSNLKNKKSLVKFIDNGLDYKVGKGFYTEKGWQYFEEKDFISSKEMFRRAIEIDSRNYEAYEGLGLCYLEQNYINESEVMFKKSIEINPNNKEVYVQLFWVYKDSGKHKEAQDILREAIDKSIDYYEIYSSLGNSYRIRGMFEEAIKMFTKSIEIMPKSILGYIGLGFCYSSQGKVELALEAIQYVMDLKPKKADIYFQAGELFMSLGKPGFAVEAFERGAEIAFTDDIYIDLGNWYISLEMVGKGEKSIKKAIEINPVNGKGYLELGKFYRKQGMYYKAEKILKEGIENCPIDDKLYGFLAICYQELGDIQLAEEYFKKANILRLKFYNTYTQKGYQGILKILKNKGIPLVCVQYPFHSVESLKNMFEDTEGVIFVDNEKVFKEELKKGSYSDFFIDSLWGDFGRCTYRGTQLMIRNIADVIIKKHFYP